MWAILSFWKRVGEDEKVSETDCQGVERMRKRRDNQQGLRGDDAPESNNVRIIRVTYNEAGCMFVLVWWGDTSRMGRRRLSSDAFLRREGW